MFLIVPSSDQTRLIGPFSSQLDQLIFQAKAERKPQYTSHCRGFDQITTRPPRVVIFAQALMQNPTTPCSPTAAHRCANRKINSFPNHPHKFSGRLWFIGGRLHPPHSRMRRLPCACDISVRKDPARAAVVAADPWCSRDWRSLNIWLNIIVCLSLSHPVMVVKVTFNQDWFPDSGRMARATQTTLPKSLQWFCLLPPSPLRGQCRIFTDFPILLHRRHLSSPKVLYFARSIKTKVGILCAECAQLHYIKNTTPPARHCQPL